MSEESRRWSMVNSIEEFLIKYEPSKGGDTQTQPSDAATNGGDTPAVALRNRSGGGHGTFGSDSVYWNHQMYLHEIVGEAFDWIYHYLELKNCPYSLTQALAQIVSKDLVDAQQQLPAQPNGGDEQLIKCDTLYKANELYTQSMALLNQMINQCKADPEMAVHYALQSHAEPFLVSVNAIKNGRRQMEDRHLILHNVNDIFGLSCPQQYSYYAIFDGHAGADAANYTAAHLHHHLLRSESFADGDIRGAFREAFSKTDLHYLTRSLREGIKTGTTVLTALIEDKTKMYLAWCGDSQAFLVRNGQPIEIMEPHKPEREDEKARIEELGGVVACIDTWRVNGTLAVSRAIGDPEHKPYVCSEPDVIEIKFDGTEDFLILACDGLWDQMTPEEASTLVYQHLCENGQENPIEAAESVSNRLSIHAKDEGSSDNITTIVIFFKDIETLMATPFVPLSPREKSFPSGIQNVQTNGSPFNFNFSTSEIDYNHGLNPFEQSTGISISSSNGDLPTPPIDDVMNNARLNIEVSDVIKVEGCGASDSSASPNPFSDYAHSPNEHANPDGVCNPIDESMPMTGVGHEISQDDKHFAMDEQMGQSALQSSGDTSNVIGHSEGGDMTQFTDKNFSTSFPYASDPALCSTPLQSFGSSYPPFQPSFISSDHIVPEVSKMEETEYDEYYSCIISSDSKLTGGSVSDSESPHDVISNQLPSDADSKPNQLEIPFVPDVHVSTEDVSYKEILPKDASPKDASPDDVLPEECDDTFHYKESSNMDIDHDLNPILSNVQSSDVIDYSPMSMEPYDIPSTEEIKPKETHQLSHDSIDILKTEELSKNLFCSPTEVTESWSTAATMNDTVDDDRWNESETTTLHVVPPQSPIDETIDVPIDDHETQQYYGENESKEQFVNQFDGSVENIESHESQINEYNFNQQSNEFSNERTDDVSGAFDFKEIQSEDNKLEEPQKEHIVTEDIVTGDMVTQDIETKDIVTGDNEIKETQCEEIPKEDIHFEETKDEEIESEEKFVNQTGDESNYLVESVHIEESKEIHEEAESYIHRESNESDLGLLSAESISVQLSDVSFSPPEKSIEKVQPRTNGCAFAPETVWQIIENEKEREKISKNGSELIDAEHELCNTSDVSALNAQMDAFIKELNAPLGAQKSASDSFGANDAKPEFVLPLTPQVTEKDETKKKAIVRKPTPGPTKSAPKAPPPTQKTTSAKTSTVPSKTAPASKAPEKPQPKPSAPKPMSRPPTAKPSVAAARAAPAAKPDATKPKTATGTAKTTATTNRSMVTSKTTPSTTTSKLSSTAPPKTTAPRLSASTRPSVGATKPTAAASRVTATKPATSLTKTAASAKPSSAPSKPLTNGTAASRTKTVAASAPVKSKSELLRPMNAETGRTAKPMFKNVTSKVDTGRSTSVTRKGPANSGTATAAEKKNASDTLS